MYADNTFYQKQFAQKVMKNGLEEPGFCIRKIMMDCFGKESRNDYKGIRNGFLKTINGRGFHPNENDF